MNFKFGGPHYPTQPWYLHLVIVGLLMELQCYSSAYRPLYWFEFQHRPGASLPAAHYFNLFDTYSARVQGGDLWPCRNIVAKVLLGYKERPEDICLIITCYNWDAFSTYSILSTFSVRETLTELTLASPEVLVTPTQDVGKILSALHATRLAGSIDLVTAIQVAQLALKHRQNKNLRQRIIAFVGSPLGDSVDEKSLVKVGKKLKKNNVALDVVSFGEHEVNEVRLNALVDAVQSGENRFFLFHDHGFEINI